MSNIRCGSTVLTRTRAAFKFALIVALPFQAAAECYQESVTVNQSRAEIREIADLQKFVKTIDKQQICTVMFRARINNKWYDGRGESQGQLTDSTDQICSQAMQAGRTQILERVAGTAIQSNQTLYCNDFQTPQLRQGLKKFDTFKISELKSVPNSQPFEYKGSVCRHFLESDIDPKTNNLMQWQIVGCVIRNEWTVVDKF
jgi:hypothetical protein